ncbi:tetratricopeptide repeat protein [Amycolatopsis sp. NPDC058278]|uniref:tetratricopeptide repeat protein n=1 Tax=Amycolatopsis sp. NPDC058278 TaxID=3346417 RepID=UPI0036D9D809
MPAFVGRESVVDRIMAVLDPQATETPAVVSGLAGGGKTAVAVHVSHIAAGHGWFPGGVLFADLGGYRDVPQKPEAVLTRFIHALGHQRDRLPTDLEELTSVYRTLLARQAEEYGATLVVLDNASSAGVVRGLLPADPAHRVLVTSRHRLGLLNAVHVELGVMTGDEAEELLVSQAGAEVVRSDPVATRRVIGFCGHLPLALRIVAALLAICEGTTMADIAEDLSDTETRLDELSCDDGASGEVEAVRRAFDLSYRRLAEEQRHMFRVLALGFGPLANVEKAAVLADVDRRAARRTLRGLSCAALLEPANRPGWYQFHDLVHLYARERSHELDGEARDAARERLLVLHERTGRSAMALITGLPDEGRSFANVQEALSWCEAEQPGVAETLQWAQDKSHDRVVTLLGVVFGTYCEHQGRLEESLELLKTSLAAGERAGERKNLQTVEAAVAGLLSNLGKPEEAARYSRQAARSARAVSDPTTALNVLIGEGYAAAAAGDKRRAATVWGEAMFKAAAAGDTETQSVILAALGEQLQSEGKFAGAIETLEGALVISEKQKGRGFASTECKLGTTYLLAGNPDKALKYLRQAVAHSADAGHAKGELRARMMLAETHGQRKDFAAARSEKLKALDLAVRLGDDDLVADLKSRLGGDDAVGDPE